MGERSLKTAIISDIHGNYPALIAVLDCIERDGISKIICLGDICGYYCMVNECIEELIKRDAICLMGNHDYYLSSDACCDSKTVKICIDYQKQIIKDIYAEWLSVLPLSMNDNNYSFRHGGWNDPLEERIEEFDFSVTKDMNENYFFSGHTHMQSIQKCGDKFYCNPGSVGQPRDHDSRAAYAVADNGVVELKRVSYDVEWIISEMKKTGLGDWIWQCLYEGKRIGE